MPKALKVKAPANAVAAPRQKLVKTAAGPIIAQTGVQSQSSAKVKSKHAVVSKTQRKHVVVSEDEDDNDDGRGDEFPDDGMGPVLASDDDEEPAVDAGLVDFIKDLNRADIDEDDIMQSEDDEPAVAQVFASQKRRGAAGIQISSSTPVSLRTQSRAPTMVPATPIASADQTVTPYTPYVPRVNPKDPSKPLLTLQSPLTRAILKKVQQQVRSKTVAEDAFPDPDALVDAISELIITIAKQSDAPRRALRFKDDAVYQENMIRMAKRSVTGVRSEVANAARDLCGPGFQLGPALGSPSQNKAYVELLLSQGNHVYRALETVENPDGSYRVVKRSGPYRHASIATIILQEFFTCHEQMAVAEHTKDMFNPIPLPVIAFAATVVQCVLRDWQAGVRVKSSSDFSADEWTTSYKAHLRELERMREAKPREVDMWTRKLWKDCWSTTSQFLANNGPDDESFITPDELDDFADIEGDT